MNNKKSASLLLAFVVCASISSVAKDHENDETGPIRKSTAIYAHGYQNGKLDARHDLRSAVLLRDWKERRGESSRYEDGNSLYSQQGRNSSDGSWQNMAREMGYQDGINDGLKDFRTGHSYRPTQGDNYKSASRGYSSRFGGKDAFKQFYREGYASGYQRGYYNNPSGGRR